jgi:hypothetical protein
MHLDKRSSAQFNLDLTRQRGFNFSHATIIFNHAHDANSFVLILNLRASELGPVPAPYHDCEDLVWVGLLQVQESGLPTS